MRTIAAFLIALATAPLAYAVQVCDPACTTAAVPVVVFNQEAPKRLVVNGQDRKFWAGNVDLAGSGKITADTNTVFRDQFGD